MDRLGSTISADPMAAKGPNSGAPPTPTPPPAAKPAQDAPTGTETPAKPESEVKPETTTKPNAAEALKKLREGGKAPEAKPETPLTPEQKKEYTVKQLRERAEKADALEKELADVRKEIETAKAAGATPDQIKVLTEERDAIKKERDDYKDRVARLDITQSEPYVENVTKPMQAIWKELTDASKKYNFPLTELSSAVQIEDGDARLEALEGLLKGAYSGVDEDGNKKPIGDLKKLEIVQAVNQFLTREYYGRQLLADSGKTNEALKADKLRRENEEKEKSTQTFNSHADEVFKQMFSDEMLEDMPWLAPKNEDGKPVPDKALMSAIRKSASSTKEPFRMALDSYSSEILPLVMEDNRKKDSEIAELKDRIGKLSGAGPKPGTPKPEEGLPDDKLSLKERVEKLQKSQGLAFNPS